jgi:hypothetical protein
MTHYKFCVVNDVQGEIILCNSQSEAEQLADSKRKHVRNHVKGLPHHHALCIAAERRAQAYRVGEISLLPV